MTCNAVLLIFFGWFESLSKEHFSKQNLTSRLCNNKQRVCDYNAYLIRIWVLRFLHNVNFRSTYTYCIFNRKQSHPYSFNAKCLKNNKIYRSTVVACENIIVSSSTYAHTRTKYIYIYKIYNRQKIKIGSVYFHNENTGRPIPTLTRLCINL